MAPFFEQVNHGSGGDDAASREVSVFFKATHVLDPHAILNNEYPLEPCRQAMPNASKLHRKLSFPFNTAYVDSLASSIAARLVENNVTPHFPRVFGIYHGTSARHYIEFTEEYAEYRGRPSFRQLKYAGVIDILPHRHERDTVRPLPPPPPESSSDDIDADLLQGIETIGCLRSKMYSDDSNSSDDACDVREAHDGSERYLEMRNTPVQIVAMEAFDDTMESVILREYRTVTDFDMRRHHCEQNARWSIAHCCAQWRWASARRAFDRRWLAVLLQVCMALSAVQHHCGMVHNDLHMQNIMMQKTDHPFLYYKTFGQCYRVPTHGYVIKVIDMGRTTFQVADVCFMGDVFDRRADAGEQYTYPHSTRRDSDVRIVRPNPAFDLARLACSMLEEIYGDTGRRAAIHEGRPQELAEAGRIHSRQRRTDSALFNLLHEWITDCHGKPIYRFENFDLYKMIARSMTATTPRVQLQKQEGFAQYAIPEETYDAATEDVRFDVTPEETIQPAAMSETTGDGHPKDILHSLKVPPLTDLCDSLTTVSLDDAQLPTVELRAVSSQAPQQAQQAPQPNLEDMFSSNGNLMSMLTGLMGAAMGSDGEHGMQATMMSMLGAVGDGAGEGEEDDDAGEGEDDDDDAGEGGEADGGQCGDGGLGGDNITPSNMEAYLTDLMDTFMQEEASPAIN